MNTDQNKLSEHVACVKGNNIPVSTKHTIEICTHLRYKNTKDAKAFLEKVIGKKTPVPFLRFKNNIGHKAGIAAGRFPVKAAKEMLQLIKSVESNAQYKGLNTENLKITKILANRAPIPFTGNRHHHGTKRTHIEIEVMEGIVSEKKESKSKVNKAESKESKPTVDKNKPVAGKKQNKTNTTKTNTTESE